ncbi:hypothetical protein [Flavobacterium nackdongense]|uniref:Uncharacterized protein n=1 Tax=Flavobacterium nackdongense TaxID=2547394 RepID=A0A4P6YCP4_9FLAO|nr:hypothetical protein [Flavobacterium nackdongense]QBN18417.1 hypothetical protein E1750_06205 [Flavobacterium nackdongense]
MKTSKYLIEIQKRLPDDIIIQNETSFEFTEDEFVSILTWIKNFNEHYRIFGKSEQPYIKFPIISKRLRLDFGLFNYPNELEINKGGFIIYISENGKLLNGTTKKNITVKELITTWQL